MTGNTRSVLTNAFLYRVFIAILMTSISLLTGCSEKSVGGGNRPPAVPSNPVPPDWASDVGVNSLLNWQCSDRDDDSLTYDMYFGASVDPPLVYSGLEERSFDPGKLEYRLTYYWRVVAGDGQYQTPGPVWRFTVRNQTDIQLRGSLELFERAGNLCVSSGYVYYCKYRTLQIINVMNPSAPFVANTVVEEGDIGFNEVYVRNNIMYVAAYLAGLRVYDVSNVFGPVLLGDSHWDNLWNAATIYVTGDYAFLGDGHGASVHVIDISDPRNPVRISFTEPLTEAGSAVQTFVYDDYAYVLLEGTLPPEPDRISIVDLTDYSAPDTVGSIHFSSGCLDLYCSDSHLFVPSGALFIFDISDPANAILATEYETGRLAVNIFIQGDLAYLALADSGVMILDISDPESPELVAEADVPEMILRVVAEGNCIYILGLLSPTLYILETVD